MGNRRRHAGIFRPDVAIAGQGAGDVGPVAVVIDPQVVVRAARVDPDEIGAANAAPVGGDVRVVDVEAGVHDGDGNRGAADAAEKPRRATVPAQRVNTHGGHGGVVGRFHQPNGFDRQHKIRIGDGVKRRPVHGGGVGADVRIEASDDRAKFHQFTAPPTGCIIGHQGNEHRILLIGWQGPDFPGERLGQLHRSWLDAQPGDFRQGGDLLHAAWVGGQPNPNQRPRSTQNLPAERVQGRAQRV